jgi:hypothetical protein
VLLGDDKHGGLADLHTGLGVVASRNVAVALLRSADKHYAARIDAEGKITGLELEK